MIGAASGFAIRCTPSQNAPVALMTMRAEALISSPLSEIRCLHAIDAARASPRETSDFRIVDEGGALFGGGGGEIDEQPGVIELAVVIHDAAAQALRLKIGQSVRAPASRDSIREAAKRYLPERRL